MQRWFIWAMFERSFLGAWSERLLNVTEDVQPTVKEQLEAQIDTLMDMYRRSKLYPYFVMFIKKGCDWPSIAMITAETVWNNKSIKYFLLEHNNLVPLGQFNDTAVRVPKQHQLCTRRGCHCLKQHMEILDKKKILQICWRKTGRQRNNTSICVRKGWPLQKSCWLHYLPPTKVPN